MEKIKVGYLQRGKYRFSVSPSRGTAGSAGWDLVTVEDVKFSLWYNIKRFFGFARPLMVHTGIAAALPEEYFGLLTQRSGISKRVPFRLTNNVGIIDADYRGEIMGAVELTRFYWGKIPAGTRVFQLVVVPYADCVFEKKAALEVTTRGLGGFGSTGK